VIEHHSLHPHCYADKVQINGSAKPSVVPQLQSQLLNCIDDVASCMRCNRLQMNTAKTEITWCSTSCRQHQLPTAAVRVGSDFVAPST
jgi:recombinational DNA repair protein RecR